jgi:hypothetical protein
VQTPDFLADPPDPHTRPGGPSARPSVDGLWSAGDRVTWLCGLVLALSAFMGWYTGTGVGVELAVIGWHTGTLGKLVFVIGAVVIAIVILRDVFDVELPASTPESLVILALGALATVFVLVRLISIPEDVLPADGRGIGLWISLVAALGVIAGGLLRAVEEL